MDSLSQAPGSILYRARRSWRALPPGEPGQALRYDEQNGIHWGPGPDTSAPEVPQQTPSTWIDRGNIAANISGLKWDAPGFQTQTEGVNAALDVPINLEALNRDGGILEVSYLRNFNGLWFTQNPSGGAWDFILFPNVTDHTQIQLSTIDGDHAAPMANPASPYALIVDMNQRPNAAPRVAEAIQGNVARWENPVEMTKVQTVPNYEEFEQTAERLQFIRSGPNKLTINLFFNGFLAWEVDYTPTPLQQLTFSDSTAWIHFFEWSRFGGMTVDAFKIGRL